MNSPIEYEQTDPRWRNIPYGPGDTIGTGGCGPTCAAMVVATLRDKNVKPPQAAAWAVERGYVSPRDGTYWSYFYPYLSYYGIKCKQIGSVEQAITALKAGYMVITSVGKGIWTSVGHFILAYGLSGDKVKIHDPNSEAAHRELANLSNYRREAVQFWIIEERWKGMDVRDLAIKDLDRGKEITVKAVLVDGSNYVKLRDLEKLAPVVIDYDGKPTIKANFKE